jgi:spore coat polysaccharide biosynthesis protein SpsF
MSSINAQRIIIILQARMGATRLPGKPLKEVLGRPLLSYQLERLRRVRLADEIVVATTLEEKDDLIVALCKFEKIHFFRGSSYDVLDRYYGTAKKYHADHIVRVTGDCPLIDPSIIDQMIRFYMDSLPLYNYVSNSLERTYPRGLDVEIFSFDLLEKAANEATLLEEREHVTLYFYTHPEMFSLGSVKGEIDISKHRWTVDTVEDFSLIEKILTALYPKNHTFTTEDILRLLDKHPEWVKINSHIQQKSV